jgi:SAM-dependent methyltransferase
MSGSYPGKLRVWEGWNLLEVAERIPVQSGHWETSATGLSQRIEELYTRETMRGPAARPKPEELADPFSLHWFLHVEKQRHGRYARWLPGVLEFTKHAGETLLGLGTGLGTDWVQYAQCGASVVACGPVAEELALARRNFELRGLPGRFLHVEPAALPLESATVDVAFIGHLPEGRADPTAVLEEIHRVLKPGGKVLFLAPARYDVDYWRTQFFPWQNWFGLGAAADRPERRFTRRQLKALFGKFRELRIHKRHLRRSEVPHLWRWLPLPLLQRWVGHYLIVKGFKPVSSALPLVAAA